jgi:endonuclease YncB( thermonuclease family)
MGSPQSERKSIEYGRYLGTVLIDGVDVNLEQVRAGMAWY